MKGSPVSWNIHLSPRQEITDASCKPALLAEENLGVWEMEKEFLLILAWGAQLLENVEIRVGARRQVTQRPGGELEAFI